MDPCKPGMWSALPSPARYRAVSAEAHRREVSVPVGRQVVGGERTDSHAEGVALRTREFARDRGKLLRRDHADDTTTMLLRLGFNLAVFTQRLDHHFHDLVPFLDVSHFPASKEDTDLHFVLVLQELFGLPDFRPDVFLTRFWTETNFLRLGVRVTRVLLFVLVVFVFAVVHDATYGGPFIGGHFDKIQTRISSPFESLLGRDDPQLLSLFAHDPNGRDSNVVVNAY